MNARGIALTSLWSFAAASGGLAKEAGVEMADALETFRQTCLTHVDHAPLIESALAKTPIRFTRDSQRSTSYRGEWVAPGARLIYSVGTAFPAPVCGLELEYRKAPKPAELVGQMETALGLPKGEALRPRNALASTRWDVPADPGRTNLVGITINRSHKGAFRVVLSAMLVKNANASRLRQRLDQQ